MTFQVLPKLVNIHNGRRKVTRLAEEVLELAKHGVAVKPELAGLLPDQVKEAPAESCLLPRYSCRTR